METFTTRKTAPVCTAVDGVQKFTLGNEFHTKHNKNEAGWDLGPFAGACRDTPLLQQ